jgi:hypothetical protein
MMLKLKNQGYLILSKKPKSVKISINKSVTKLYVSLGFLGYWRLK